MGLGQQGPRTQDARLCAWSDGSMKTTVLKAQRDRQGGGALRPRGPAVLSQLYLFTCLEGLGE